jgi:protein TonB
VEEQAIPLDGMKDFYKYINQNLVFKKKARRQGLDSRIFISFLVEKDGKLTDIKISENIEEEQTIKLLKQYKPWKPAKIKDTPIRQKVSISIIICFR